MFYVCVQRFDEMDEKIFGWGTKQGLKPSALLQDRFAMIALYIHTRVVTLIYISLDLRCI